IWKDIKLRFWNDVRIENVKYSLISLGKTQADLEFTLDLVAEKDHHYTLLINEKTYPIKLKKGLQTVKVPYEVQNPKLWWTNGLGEQNLYEFNIELHPSKKSEVLDQKNLTIGIRTIELVQEPDEL